MRMKNFCRRKELEFLIGHLHHACKIAPQGWTFLRHMINLLCAFWYDDHPIRLNREFQVDLWWQELLQVGDGLSLFLTLHGLPFQTARFHLMLPVLLVMVQGLFRASSMYRVLLVIVLSFSVIGLWLMVGINQSLLISGPLPSHQQWFSRPIG